MPIIGKQWFKNGQYTTADGVNTVVHGLRFTPHVNLVQYVSGGTDTPTLPLMAEAASQTASTWRFRQSNGASVTVEVYCGRLHSIIW